MVLAMVSALDARVAEEPTQLGRGLDLTRVGTARLESRAVRHLSATQGLHGDGRDDAGRARQPVSRCQHERADGTHHLRAVEQGQAFLGFEHQGFQAGFCERSGGRHGAPFVLHHAMADDGQCQMGQGSEVARGAHAALAGHDRVDALAQQLQEAVDEFGPTAGVAEGQRVRPEQQHGPHDLGRQGLADASGVTQEQAFLQLSGALRRHIGGGQRAEAGGDSVDDLAAGHQALDDGARLGHARAGLIRELDRAIAPCDGFDVGHRQLGTIEHEGSSRERARGSLAHGLFHWMPS
jgi:hypothetical protein